MKLVLKQRLFTFLDSYDIYDEFGNIVFHVKSVLSLGHEMHVFDNLGNEVGTIKQRLLHLLPTFEIWIGGVCAGYIKKDFSFFRPSFTLNYGSFKVTGDIMHWDYTVTSNGKTIMQVTKKLLKLSDTYELLIWDESQIVPAVLIALAIDAEKCSRS